MKYKISKIKEDKNILSKFSLHEIARRTGITVSYLSLLNSGKRIASEEIYNKIKEAIKRG